jgi:predicted short-subunit dehydrogenase-like oxidoreductase (DUF2520 family)
MIKTRPLRVALVGAGRVGRSIALLLTKLGHQIETVISRAPARARAAAKQLGAHYGITPGKIFPAPDLLFITTADNAIHAAALAIATAKINLSRTIALHCSGAFGSELLAPLKEHGAAIGSLHPLKSISQPIKSIDEWAGIYWCIEGDKRALNWSRKLARAAGGNVAQVSAEMKPIYHAAAVMACGHTVSLIDLSVSMLIDAGIQREQALLMLLPLIQGTIKNLAASDCRSALTGPFARGDFNTINQHLQALLKLEKDYLTIYSLLGRHSLELLKTKTKA